MITKEPKAEVQIDIPLIQNLLATQYPQLADEKIEFLDAGWDNENYRVGQQHIIRLPRRKVAVSLLQNEVNWLPKVQKQLQINIPAPIFVGKKTTKYPWPWTIVPWTTGKTANLNRPNESETATLAHFLKALHPMDATDAPANASRGVHLSEKMADLSIRIERLKTKTSLVTSKIEQLLDRALNSPFPTKKCLLHGDLHPRNMIVHEGKIVSIIDWGDITDGDPATDLASFWMLFDQQSSIEKGLKIYGATTDLIHRAIGWAIFFGVILLDTGLQDNEQHAEIGATTLRRLDAWED